MWDINRVVKDPLEALGSAFSMNWLLEIQIL